MLYCHPISSGKTLKILDIGLFYRSMFHGRTFVIFVIEIKNWNTRHCRTPLSYFFCKTHKNTNIASKSVRCRRKEPSMAMAFLKTNKLADFYKQFYWIVLLDCAEFKNRQNQIMANVTKMIKVDNSSAAFIINFTKLDELIVFFATLFCFTLQIVWFFDVSKKEPKGSHVWYFLNWKNPSQNLGTKTLAQTWTRTKNCLILRIFRGHLKFCFSQNTR